MFLPLVVAVNDARRATRALERVCDRHRALEMHLSGLVEIAVNSSIDEDRRRTRERTGRGLLRGRDEGELHGRATNPEVVERMGDEAARFPPVRAVVDVQDLDAHIVQFAPGAGVAVVLWRDSHGGVGDAGYWRLCSG